ncbi:hypothetical protein [Burkholderia pyrrocinia]|uniref:hypothetical protein n=1 Tax=Burkholderia pyrrocinia TaxID=60550 RepID=UPI001588C633|nr:hypothetical protein [Burkholderia pyrrocinia]
MWTQKTVGDVLLAYVSTLLDVQDIVECSSSIDICGSCKPGTVCFEFTDASMMRAKSIGSHA